MLRLLNWLSLALWSFAWALPIWIARFAALSLLVIGAGVLGWLVMSPAYVLGPVTEYLALEGNDWSLARVEIPGFAPQTLILYEDGALSLLEAGESWIFATGAPVDRDGVMAFEVTKYASMQTDPRLAELAAPYLDGNEWIFVAAGFLLVLFGTLALKATAAGLMAAYVTVLTWHALHLASFEQLITKAQVLAPFVPFIGVVLGLAIGTRVAFNTPGRGILRLAAVLAGIVMLPWVLEVYPLQDELSLVLPLLFFVAPWAAPALAAALAVTEGLDLGATGALWALAVCGLASLTVVALAKDPAGPVSQDPSTSQDPGIPAAQTADAGLEWPRRAS